MIQGNKTALCRYIKMWIPVPGSMYPIPRTLYSTYEHENESISSDNPQDHRARKSGPIRIGQGVEFDYATVHCVKTLA